MEDFITEDEEPWYDQRDLEQGEDRGFISAGSSHRAHIQYLFIGFS